MHPAASTILAHLQIEEAPLLGQGMTSAVYALDDERAVKIYFGEMSQAELARLQTFYARLDQQSFPFATPRIDAINEYEGIWYSVERRLPGREMAQVFPALSHAHKRNSLLSFLDALPAIHRVEMTDLPYGELLQDWEPVQAETWQGFLRGRAEVMLRHFYDHLAEDIAAIDAVIEDYFARVKDLPAPAPKRLVHGDYFFGNVLVDERGAVTAIIDFGPLTLVGDPVVDLMGAYYFSEMYDFFTPDDAAVLWNGIEERHGEVIWEQVEFYLLFYGLRFSNCKTFDPRTYRWAVKHLKRYADRHGLTARSNRVGASLRDNCR